MGCLPDRERSLEDSSRALLSFYSSNSITWQQCFKKPAAAGPLQIAFPNLSLQSLSESFKGPMTSPRVTEALQLLKKLVWGTMTNFTGLKSFEGLDTLLHGGAVLRYETLQLLYYLYRRKLWMIPERLKATIQQMKTRLPSYNRLQITSGQIHLLSLVLVRESPDPGDLRDIHHWILQVFSHLLECKDLVGIFTFLIERNDDIVAKLPLADAERLEFIRHLSIIDLELFIRYLSLFNEVERPILCAVFAADPQNYIGMHGISNSLGGLIRNEERLKLFLQYSNASKDITAVLELCNEAVEKLTEVRKFSSAQSVLQQVLTYIPTNMPNFEVEIIVFSKSFQLMGILDVSNYEFASNYINNLIASENNTRKLENTQETLNNIMFCLCRHCGNPLYEELLVKYIVHVIDHYEFVSTAFQTVCSRITKYCNWLPQLRQPVISELRRVISQSSEEKSELLLLETELTTQVSTSEPALNSSLVKTLIIRLAAAFPLDLNGIQSTEHRKLLLEECEAIAEQCKKHSDVDYADVPIADLNDSTVFPKILISAIKQIAINLQTLLEDSELLPDEMMFRTWRIRSAFLKKFANSLFFQMLFLKATEKPLCCYILTEFLDVLLIKIDWKAIDLHKENADFAYYAAETKIMAAALHGFQAPSRELANELAVVAKSNSVISAFVSLGLSTDSFDDLLKQVYFTPLPILDYGQTIYGGIILLNNNFLSESEKHGCAMKVTLCHELARASRRVTSQQFQVGRRGPTVQYYQGMVGRPDLQTVVSDDAEGGKALENELFGAFITLIGYDQIVFLCNSASWTQDSCGFKDRLEELGQNESGEPMKLCRSERGNMSFDRRSDRPAFSR